MAQNVFDRYCQFFSQKTRSSSDPDEQVKQKKVRKRDQMPDDWLKSN